MKAQDSTPLIKASLFLTQDGEEVTLPLFIATFPYLAMCKIKIPKGKVPPSIKIQLQVDTGEIETIERIIKPHFSSVISTYISINSSKPDLEDYKYLYKRFLYENKNSIEIPSKESIKVCRYFILKKNKFSYFAPFFLAASFFLIDPIPIQYVHIYSQLRINGQIRSITELVDYSSALYSFLVNENTQQKFMFNSQTINISYNKNTKNSNNNNNNNNNNDDDDIDINDININELESDDDYSISTESYDEDYLFKNRDQILFQILLKETISDVLDDLEKAELHGAHSSILFLVCVFTGVFKNEKVLLPKKWHFMPIELISRNQNDQKRTGRFLSDNFSFVETSISNNPLSAIICFSPLFNNEVKKLTESIITIKHNFQARDAILLTGLKLQQLNRIVKRIQDKPKKLNFVYFYSMPHPDYVKKLFDVVNLFNHKSRNKGTPTTELIAEQRFAQLYWRTIFHYIPNRAIFPAIVPKPIGGSDQKGSLKNEQIDQAYANFNKIVKEHNNEPDTNFYQQYYNSYLKNMLYE